MNAQKVRIKAALSVKRPRSPNGGVTLSRMMKQPTVCLPPVGGNAKYSTIKTMESKDDKSERLSKVAE